MGKSPKWDFKEGGHNPKRKKQQGDTWGVQHIQIPTKYKITNHLTTLGWW